MVMTYHRDWTPAKKKRVAERIARKKGVIGGKGSREQAKTEIEGREGRIGGTMSVRRKVIIETIARSKTRLNLGRIPSSMGRPSGVIGAKAPAIVGKRRRAGIRRKPQKSGAPAEVVETRGGISAIVHSIMRMIFGK